MTESKAKLPATIDKQPTHPRLWPLWILAALALLGAIVLGLWSWQQWQNTQAMRQSINNLEQETAQLERQYGQSGNQRSQRLQALENKLSSQRELIATQQRQIDHNARELLEAGNRTRTDWLLAEAEYLLRVANQRLIIEKDIRGALAALRSADEVLHETDDIGVYPVREQLAREIMMLKSLTDVDRTGLYLTLEAAIESIQQLTENALANDRMASTLAQSESDSSTATAADSRWWMDAWNNARETLGRVVVVRRMDEPVKPMLSPEQSVYLRLNLQLMLEEAELAVLRGHQEMYSSSLGRASQAINTWYDSTNPKIIALSDTLEEMASRNIDPELPDISKSLQLLKGRLAGRLNSDSGQSDSSASGPDTSAKEGDS